jgi:uncharacterized cupredoxin-like copper-binding protein
MRSLCLALLVVAGASAVASPALAKQSATVVNVELQDTSTGGDVTAMRIKPDRDAVPAGPVVFHVTNESKEQIHEMLVVQTDGSGKPLPYDAKRDRVVESRIKHLGEVSDLKPGGKGTLRLTLRPGSYLLICNETGHYKAGMSTPLTVTQAVAQ